MIELIQSSTVHGVNHIYSASNKFSKVFWSILFCFGVVGIIVNLVFLLNKYFSYPIQVNYSMDIENFIWPDITICNPTAPYNLESNSKSYEYWKSIFNKSKEIVHQIATETKLFQIIHKDQNTDYELEERTIAMTSADQRNLEVHIYKNNIISVDYTVPHPGIHFVHEYKDDGPLKFPVNLDNFFSTRILQIRNNIPCHTFTIDKTKFNNSKEIESIVFNYKFNYESYRVFNSSYLSRSLLIYFSNKGEFSQSKEVILLPGFDNIVSLLQSRYHYSGLGRKCRKIAYKINLYDALLSSANEMEGSYDVCLKVVSQKIFVEQCRCYSPFLPIYKNETGFPRLCLNTTMFTKSEIINNAKCLVNVYNRFKNSIEIESQCRKYKPMKCNELFYKVEQRKEMLVETWSKTANERRNNILKNFAKIFIDKESYDKDFHDILRNNFIKFTIKREYKFGDLYSEEESYPFSQLLSDIGGLMGLWLGLSIVGLFEIFEFIWLFFKSIRKKSEINSDQDENLELNAIKIV